MGTTVKSFVAFLALLLLVPPGAIARVPQPNPSTPVLGVWQVVRVICSTCNNRGSSDAGTVIVFDSARITNPFGGDCGQSPGYDRLRKISADRLLETKGKLWPTELRKEIKSSVSLLYGYITCAGMNHMRMIFADGERAYYFWEGDRVFVLERKRL